MLAVLVFLATAMMAFGLMAGRAGARRRQAPDRRHRGDRRGRRGRGSGPHGSSKSGLKAAQQILDYSQQALWQAPTRRRQGPAPAPDPGRHLRSARGRLFLRRAPGAGDRAGARRFIVYSEPWSRSAPRVWLVVLVAGVLAYGARASISDGASRRVWKSIAPASRISWNLLVVCGRTFRA